MILNINDSIAKNVPVSVCQAETKTKTKTKIQKF